MQRTASVVKSSREAAELLHSPQVFGDQQVSGFAGVDASKVELLLDELRKRRIGANLGDSLDEEIRKVIDDLSVAANVEVPTSDPEKEILALQCATNGDTPALRLLSIEKHTHSIRSARDSRGRSCLHLAIENGNFITAKWLYEEVNFDPTITDDRGVTCLELLSKQSDCDGRIRALLSK